MKKIEYPVLAISSASIGIGLATNRALVAAFYDKNSLPNLDRLLESFKKFQKEHIKAIQQKNLKGAAVNKAAELFLNELKSYMKLPVAQNKELRHILYETQKIMQSLMNSWKKCN